MSSVIIYEVNLDIKKDVYEKHKQWLFDHMKEMVTFNNFIKVNILQQLSLDPTDDRHHHTHRITAQYFVPSYKILENYLTNHAKDMRNQALEIFKDNFSVSRRVFKFEEVFELSPDK